MLCQKVLQECSNSKQKYLTTTTTTRHRSQVERVPTIQIWDNLVKKENYCNGHFKKMNKYIKTHETIVYPAKKQKNKKKSHLPPLKVTISPILSLNIDNQREEIKHLLCIV